MALIQVGDTWQFGSEFELEEVVWKHLPQLLNLQPFERQYSVRGQYCDILALDGQQLVVVELKNVEDRYVVQQLTRYYEALKEAAPFGPEVDLSQPIRLIAIAPSFHQDTLTDCKYNLLDIELISFQIQFREKALYLELLGSEQEAIAPLLLQQETDAPQPEIPVSEPPRKLLNWLSHASEAEFDAIIRMRKQILSFDERMKEVIESDRIVYGRGKSKPCCELRKNGKHGYTRTKLARFLWLPHPEGKTQILRLLVGTEASEQKVIGVVYCPKLFQAKEIWKFPGLAHWPGNYINVPESYKPFLDESLNCSLYSLVNLALQTWINRL